MQSKLVRIFIFSSGLILSITAIAKLVSANGGARVLQIHDPILTLSFQHVFWIIGTLELVVATACFFSKRLGLQAGLVAWLATSFLIYRLGLLWVGYHKPCPCLGNFTDALHISPQTADTAMKIILGYLLVSSYATLFWLWRQKQQTPPATPSGEMPVSTT